MHRKAAERVVSTHEATMICGPRVSPPPDANGEGIAADMLALVAAQYQDPPPCVIGYSRFEAVFELDVRICYARED